MTDPLFAELGPEGNNAAARDFEQRLTNGLASTLRAIPVTNSVDAWLPPTRRSRGLDGLWSFADPRTGRGTGWVIEAKRHDGQSRYTKDALGTEIQSLRDKVVTLRGQPEKFFRDPQIRPHVQVLQGGLLFHHCRDFDRAKVRSLLADLPVHGHLVGPAPPRVLFIGPDDLNGFAEAVCRYGSPVEYWWPMNADLSGAWSPVCPPAQLAAGVLFFRTEEHGTVLLFRETIERRDVEAVSDLAYRFGKDIDVVACAGLRSEQVRLLSEYWAQARSWAEKRDRARLPDRVAALEVSDGMGPFERTWHAEGPQHAAASVKRKRSEHGSAVAVSAKARRAHRELTAYPSTTAVYRTILEKAPLAAARAFLAAEGVQVFAHEKLGAAVAAGEVWLSPAAYRRMGDRLETTGQPVVTGIRVRRVSTPLQVIDGLDRGPVFDEMKAAAERLVGIEVGDKQIRLLGAKSGEQSWPLVLELVYEDVYDLVGGERIARDAHATLLVRPVANDEADVCIVTDDPADRRAARTWISRGLELATRGWQLVEVALPGSGSSRIEVLGEVLDAVTDGCPFGVADPDHHRDRASRGGAGPTVHDSSKPEDEFVRGIRDARYNTEVLSLAGVLARGEQDRVLVGELTSFRGHTEPDGRQSYVALRARQAPKEAFLSLVWKGGRQQTGVTEGHRFSIGLWEQMTTLGWTREKKHTYLAERWIEAADRVRAAEQRIVQSLRESA